MVKYIKVESWRNPVFKSLPYGTKLYLKTTDDIVREVKIIGGEFRADKEGYVYIFYKYQIAGLAGSFYGTARDINDNGVRGSFYPKMECITQSPLTEPLRQAIRWLFTPKKVTLKVLLMILMSTS